MSNTGPATPIRDLASLQARIKDDEALTPARRAAVCSAINVACRWIALPPAVVPANVAYLSAKLEPIEPAAAGVTRKRFATIKSDVLFALRHAGLAGKGTARIEMTPAWRALWNRLPCKYSRTAMSRLFRYCSAQAISPDAVSDLVLADFGASLKAETLIKDPRVTHQNACRVWNRLAEQVPGWPSVRLTVPRYADHYIRSWSEFPSSFHDEVEAYLANLQHDDVLNLDAPPRALRSRTIKSYRYELRRFASLLVQRGHAPERVTSLAHLVDPSHVEDGLRALLARHGNEKRPTMFDLATLLVKVAKHWVKVAPDALGRLQGYARNLRPDARGLGTKNRQRLAPLRDERNLARLFLLPGKICKAIEAKPRRTYKGALLMQHAVALMILTYAPIRIGNLAALRCDVNLRWSNAHKKGSLIIDIDGHDVKNHQTLTFPQPDGCAAMIRTYIEAHLPLLAPDGNVYLFPSDVAGRPKRSDTLGKQLSKLIRRTIGLEVNPHLYRHLVHLVVLNRYPGAYALISRVLGHKSLQTAISNYAGEDIAIAMRTFQDLITEATAGRLPRASVRTSSPASMRGPTAGPFSSPDHRRLTDRGVATG